MNKIKHIYSSNKKQDIQPAYLQIIDTLTKEVIKDRYPIDIATTISQKMKITYDANDLNRAIAIIRDEGIATILDRGYLKANSKTYEIVADGGFYKFYEEESRKKRLKQKAEIHKYKMTHFGYYTRYIVIIPSILSIISLLKSYDFFDTLFWAKKLILTHWIYFILILAILGGYILLEVLRKRRTQQE